MSAFEYQEMKPLVPGASQLRANRCGIGEKEKNAGVKDIESQRRNGREKEGKRRGVGVGGSVAGRGRLERAIKERKRVR